MRHWITTATIALSLLSYLVQAEAAAPEAQPLPTALVLQDAIALRAAPRDSATSHAQLWRGEALEIRGERQDFWQVYDYRRERGGFVRKTQMLRLSTGPEAASDLLAALRLVRHQAGAEGLGLGLASAYVQAASPAQLAAGGAAEALDALGSLAERLADRATLGPANASKAAEAQLAGQLDVAARYGLRFQSLEAPNGRVQLCFDGEAFRRVLALKAPPETQVRAALSLTRPDCQDPQATPRDREARDLWRAEVLDKVDASTLPPHWKNRLLMRRAAVWSSLSHARSRRDDAPASAAAAHRALAEFAGILPSELSEDDGGAYQDAAMRSNTVRWAALPALKSVTLGAWVLQDSAQADGQHCLQLTSASQATANAKAATPAPWVHCGPGLPQLASASLNREGQALAIAVQASEGWQELWVIQREGPGWSLQVLPPAAASPGVGYAELAGWVPGGKQLLVAREVRAEDRYKRSFEVLSLATLHTERQSSEAMLLGPFQRWQDPQWKRNSLSLR